MSRKIDHDELRRLVAAGLNDQQIADRFGAHVTWVYKLRKRLRIVSRYSASSRNKFSGEQLAALVADGLTDPQIASRLGCHADTVLRRRRSIGLPSRYDRSAPPAHVRVAQSQAATGSLPAAIAADAVRHRAVSARYGLPPMRPKCVRVLMTLLDGPLTKAAVRDRYGGTWGTSEDPLAELVRVGFVFRVQRATGSARKSSPDVYMLTMKALEVLSADQGSDVVTHEDCDGGGGQAVAANS